MFKNPYPENTSNENCSSSASSSSTRSMQALLASGVNSTTKNEPTFDYWDGAGSSSDEDCQAGSETELTQASRVNVLVPAARPPTPPAPRGNPEDLESGPVSSESNSVVLEHQAGIGYNMATATEEHWTPYSITTILTTGIYCGLWRLFNLLGIGVRGNTLKTLIETLSIITPALSSGALITDIVARIYDYKRQKKCGSLWEATKLFWQEDGLFYIVIHYGKNTAVSGAFTMGDWVARSLLDNKVSRQVMEYLISPLTSATFCLVTDWIGDAAIASKKGTWNQWNMKKSMANSLLVNFAFGAVGGGALSGTLSPEDYDGSVLTALWETTAIAAVTSCASTIPSTLSHFYTFLKEKCTQSQIRELARAHYQGVETDSECTEDPENVGSEQDALLPLGLQPEPSYGSINPR